MIFKRGKSSTYWNDSFAMWSDLRCFFPQRLCLGFFPADSNNPKFTPEHSDVLENMPQLVSQCSIYPTVPFCGQLNFLHLLGLIIIVLFFSSSTHHVLKIGQTTAERSTIMPSEFATCSRPDLLERNLSSQSVLIVKKFISSNMLWIEQLNSSVNTLGIKVHCHDEGLGFAEVVGLVSDFALGVCVGVWLFIKKKVDLLKSYTNKKTLLGKGGWS